MTSCVLDASALLAMLLGEVGAEAVWKRRYGAVISAVSYAETLMRLARHGKPLDQADAHLRQLELDPVPFDREQAVLVASLAATGKRLGLTVGDRACLALGLQRGLPVLTAEKAWKKLDPRITVELIR